MVNVGTNMKLSILLGVALSLLLWVAAPAQAQTAEDLTVEDQINALKADTVAANFTNQKDEDGLLGTLDSAITKLQQGKTEDALKNLNSFVSKVESLPGQGKLEQSEADALSAGAQDVIDRINGQATAA